MASIATGHTWLALIWLCIGLVDTRDCVYTVGIYFPAKNEATISEMYKPLFQDFLTESARNSMADVGCNNTIRFSILPIVEKEPSMNLNPEEVRNGTVDFIVSPQLMTSCYAAEFEVTPILKLSGLPKQPAGTVFIARAGNANIASLQSLRGKVIATTHQAGIFDFLLGSQLLREQGIHIEQEAKQVVFFSFNRREEAIQSVLSGSSDAAMVASFLFEDYLEQGIFKLDDFIFIGPHWTSPGSSGVGNNVYTSRLAIPEYYLGAMPSVPTPVVQAVTMALMMLNSSHPALVAAGVTALVPPVHWFGLSSLMQQMSIMIFDESLHTWRCDFETASTIQCPPTSFKRSQSEITSGCAMRDLPCRGEWCVCSPCRDGQQIQVFASSLQSKDNASVPCQKMSECAVIQAQSSLALKLVDNAWSLDSRVTPVKYILHPPAVERSNTSVEASSVYALMDKEQPGTFEAVVSVDEGGSYLLEILYNGTQISASPVWITVLSKACPEGSSRMEGANGVCICTGFTIDIGGQCVQGAVVLPSIIVPLVLLLALAAYIVDRRRTLAARSLWVIDGSDLVFDVPPMVLGIGTFAPVLHAFYRGTGVAVKVVLPRRTTQDEDGTSKDSLCLSAFRSRHISFLSSPPSVMWSLPNTTCPSPPLGNTRGSVSALASANVNNLPPINNRNSIASIWAQSNNSLVAQGAAKTTTGARSGGSSPDAVPSHRNSIHSTGPRHNSESSSITGGDSLPRSHGPRGTREFQELPMPPLPATFDTLGGVSLTQLAEVHKSLLSDARSRNGSGVVSVSGSAKRVSWWGWRFWKRSRRSRQGMLEDFIREMRVMFKLKHPNIATIMGAVIYNTREPLLVMEYMTNGSLFDVLHNETVILEGDMIGSVFQDIVNGMCFLHSSKPPIIHGNLKSENVLIDSSFRAKVSDFGFSQKQSLGRQYESQQWMSPEMILGAGPSRESDVYAFGITLYELISRQEPYTFYEGQSFDDMLPFVASPGPEGILFRPEIPESCPEEMKKIMNDCWAHAPSDRPTFEELSTRARNLDLTAVGLGTGAMQQILLDMFPKHVAEALIAGRKVEPEKKDCVSIFFSDIVGFTMLSQTMDASAVSDMLDRLYSRFDELSREWNVFKVETIGDAFIACTNLIEDQSDHAGRLARFAIAAVRAAEETLVDPENPARGSVNIRVGLHSGPVVASVVGSRKKKYVLLGDSVNTASRMESHGVGGKIHVSRPTAKLIREQAPELGLEERGVINVKGKGKMRTYWVTAERLPSSDATRVRSAAMHRSECEVVLEHDGTISRVPSLDIHIEGSQEFQIDFKGDDGSDVDVPTADMASQKGSEVSPRSDFGIMRLGSLSSSGSISPRGARHEESSPVSSLTPRSGRVEALLSAFASSFRGNQQRGSSIHHTSPRASPKLSPILTPNHNPSMLSSANAAGLLLPWGMPMSEPFDEEAGHAHAQKSCVARQGSSLDLESLPAPEQPMESIQVVVDGSSGPRSRGRIGALGRMDRDGEYEGGSSSKATSTDSDGDKQVAAAYSLRLMCDAYGSQLRAPRAVRAQASGSGAQAAAEGEGAAVFESKESGGSRNSKDGMGNRTSRDSFRRSASA